MQHRNLMLFLMLLRPCLGWMQPLPCDGRFLISVAPSGQPSRMYAIDWSQADHPAQFHSFSSQPGQTNLNAIGFRVTDQYLYGVHPTQHVLYRLGSDGQAHQLGSIALHPKRHYFAGDMSPDGRYLVLLGSQGIPPVSESIAWVDLEDPKFPVRELLLSSSAPLKPVYCADIAFHPASGLVYGYDGRSGTLLKIDPQSGRMMPISNQALSFGVMPHIGAIAFDPFGRLYGYGGERQLNTLYQIDLSTGRVRALSEGPVINGTDGCSCSYTVDLQQTIQPKVAPACSDLELNLIFSNHSGNVQGGLSLRDSLPPGMEFKEVLHNPFHGNIRLESNGRVLIVEDLVIPPGIDSLTFIVSGGPENYGTFSMQASLKGLPLRLGSQRLSDDPQTGLFDDPTNFTLLPADTQFIERSYIRCPDKSLELKPSVSGSRYLWKNGTTNLSRVIHEKGEYQVAVHQGCQQWIERIQVKSPELDVELGPNQDITLGESRTLSPKIRATPPYSVSWSSNPPTEWSCPDCTDQYVTPLENTVYSITVTDSAGCVSSDELQLQVKQNREIYAPNAFSPNHDGFNDFFFLQSEEVVNIRNFFVFDRWGNPVFQVLNGQSNDPRSGWNGTTARGPAPTGVYLFRATLIFPDGVEQSLSGDLMLIR